VNANQIPTHFGNVRVAPIGPDDFRLTSPVTISTKFLNFMPTNLTIVERCGLKHNLKNVPSLTNRDLIIRVERNIGFTAKEGMSEMAAIITNESSEELKAIKEAHLSNNSLRAPNFMIVIDYVITYDELRNANGTLYHNELDLVISINDIKSTPIHPYSTEGMRDKMMKEKAPEKTEAEFSYSIDIIDNSGKYGDRFQNIGNQIYRIKARKDNTMKDGVYRISNKPVIGANDPGEQEVVYYSMEDAEEKIPLYRTIEDARCLGDLSMAQKARVAVLESEAVNAKHEAAVAKSKLEEVQHARKIEGERIAEERERFNATLESMRESTKFRYEQRSYDRKDSSEMIKFLPGFFMGAIALFAAFKATS
jgi:hypothetical protein